MTAPARARRTARAKFLIASILSAAMFGTSILCSAAVAAEAAKVTIVVFTPPSLGAVFPAIIKQQKYDIANGVDISFVERTPDAYAAQFNSGEFKVGGSASVLILGLGNTRGIKISYLFNLFDFWGTAVTNRSDIRTLADLKGRQIAAAKGTTNFTVFEWFAQQQGVEPKSLQVLNTATPGLLGYALADRADAVQIWEPAYSMLLAKRPGIHTIDLNIRKVWHAYAGRRPVPQFGRRRPSGLDRAKSRRDSPALSRLQAGGRMGGGASGRSRAAGRPRQGGGRTQGDCRDDPRQFAAGDESLSGQQGHEGDRGGLPDGHRGRPLQDLARRLIGVRWQA